MIQPTHVILKIELKEVKSGMMLSRDWKRDRIKDKILVTRYNLIIK